MVSGNVGVSSTTASTSQTTNNVQLTAFPSTSSTLSFIPAASSTASSVITAITTATGSPFFTSASSSSTQSQTKAPSNAVVTPITSFISSTKHTAPSASSSALPAVKPILTKPQIAGVVVAAIGAAALAFGFCFLIFYFRRRRRSRRRSGSSFGGDKIMDSEETTPDMAVIAARDFAHGPQATTITAAAASTRRLSLSTPAHTGGDGWSQWSRNTHLEAIGLAVGPEVTGSAVEDRSPITPSTRSYRTTSQLLPDKPTYSLFPPPLRGSNRSSPAAQSLKPPIYFTPGQRISPATRSAPRSPTSMDTSQKSLQSTPGARDPDSDPFVDSSSRSPLNVYPCVQTSRPRSSHSTRPDRDKFRSVSMMRPTDVVRKPLPAHQSPSARGLRPASSRTQQPNLPRPYLPPPPIEQHYLEAMDYSHKRRKSNSRRPLTHFSSGSETSFEDADDDESLDPRSALSPVAESPAIKSPRQGQVMYPRIPVSAAESPTRRPNNRELPTRSDSLLNRRLGKEKAKEIAGRLQGPAQTENEDIRNTAKWKLLVSPGLEPLESSGSPQSAKNTGKTPLLRRDEMT
ncbi:hypothetical protein MMC28_000917 [Mycoblastus sanguinarius]|nr:hypothetical protein [Mycoblastus sanguinarius]